MVVEFYYYLIGVIIQFVDVFFGGFDVQCDWFFIYYLFVIIDGFEDMVDMELGWRFNDNSVDCGVVENFVWI